MMFPRIKKKKIVLKAFLAITFLTISEINAQSAKKKTPPVKDFVGKPSCVALERFRTGVFRYKTNDPKLKSLVLYRGKEGQVEMNEASSSYFITSLRYLPDCRYQVEIINSSLPEKQTAKLLGFKTVYEVVDFTENTVSLKVVKSVRGAKKIALKNPDMIITMIKTGELEDKDF